MKKNNDGLEPETKQKIIDLSKAVIPDASIWLYGSRVRGDFTSNSDVDLLLESSKGPIDFFTIAELKNVLSASDISHRVDVVDYNSISDEKFKADIAGGRVLWKK
jgi:uncharacterized protein